MFWRRKKSNWGATLAEVMIVTGIMQSLAGGGSGVFNGVKDRAKRTQCLNNLRQLGQAIQMFAMLNDGALPEACFYPIYYDQQRQQWFLAPADRHDKSIKKALGPHVGNAQVFLCPAAPEKINQLGLSYLWNDQVNGKMLDTLPPNTWLLQDMNGAAFGASALIPPSHEGGYHVLWADGSVRWINQPAPVLKAEEVQKLKAFLEQQQKAQEKAAQEAQTPTEEDSRKDSEGGKGPETGSK